MKSKGWVGSLLLCATFSRGIWAGEIQVPDFRVAEKTAGSERVLVITPPESHHINLDAPLGVRAGERALTRKEGAKPTEVDFAAPKDLQGPYTATVYLCDDGNRYCVKKTMEGKLGQAAASPVAAEAEAKAKAPRAAKTAAGGGLFFRGEKDGFIYNDAARALALARKTGKPLLIDFYGIWCPPCNVMDETVFHVARYRKPLERFVRLKLDADASASWELKDKYKIGGYPTFIFADASGEEISRVVGSREPGAFAKEMDRAYQLRKEPVSAVQSKAENGDREAQFRLGQQALEREELESADRWLTQASQGWKPGDRRFESLYDAKIRLLKERSKKAPESREALAALLETAARQVGPGYFQVQAWSDLAELRGDLGKKAEQTAAFQAAVESARKALSDPKALEGGEAGPQDLWVMMADAQKSLGQDEEARKSYGEAAQVYRKLIAAMPAKAAERERGWNLELAYCLRESGKPEEAEKLYQRLEALYPDEFTFHYAHARMLQAQKRLPEAQAQAEKALANSYGDNRIRSAQTLAEIHQAQGNKAAAKAVIQEVLSTTAAPADPLNRTHRYLAKLKELDQKL